MKTVFVDSSVLFTAVNSPSGGSAKLISLRKYELLTSTFVLTEVERNVRKKLQDYHLERFFVLVESLKISKEMPHSKVIAHAKQVIAVKDAIILAQAKELKIHYLVTLDQKDFFQPKVFSYFAPGKIITPKDLITQLH